MRVLICGDRYWDDINTMLSNMKELPEGTTVIHGCAKGADSMADSLAGSLGLTVIGFNANWEKYGKAAGPIRNKAMLVEGKPDIVWAFHNDLENSKGTKNMVSQAKAANIPVIVITTKDA